MKNLLLIDHANTAFRSLAVNHHLEHNGICTGGLYGYYMQLISQLNKLNPIDVVICKDQPPYLRNELYPSYKEDRKAIKKPEWYEHKKITFELIDQFINILGLNVVAQAGFEADDIIATLIKLYTDQYEKIYVLSNDDDLFQLLTYKNVILFRKSNSARYEYMSHILFELRYKELKPQDWSLYTALVGSHNNVKGINRCGPVTALNWITYQKSTGEPHPKMVAHLEQIKFTQQLVTIPLPLYQQDLENVLKTKSIIPMTPNKRSLRSFLEYHGIQLTDAARTALSQ